MGNVILYIAASLDGFIATSDGGLGWLDKYQRHDEDCGYRDFYARVGASIMGAKTCEKSLMLEGAIDEHMPTYVVTHREKFAQEYSNVVLHSSGLRELLSIVKSKTEKDIWLVGGGQLTQSFLRESLLDEIILSTIPVILGEGISLLGGIGKEVELTLKENKVYATGVMQTRYRPRD